MSKSYQIHPTVKCTLALPCQKVITALLIVCKLWHFTCAQLRQSDIGCISISALRGALIGYLLAVKLQIEMLNCKFKKSLHHHTTIFKDKDVGVVCQMYPHKCVRYQPGNSISISLMSGFTT